MGALRRSHACALVILAAFALGAACQLVAALAFAEVIIDFPLHSSARCLVASLAGAGLAASCVLLGVCCRLLSVPSAAAGQATRCAAAILAASTLVAFSWLFGDEYDSPSQQLEMALDFDGDALEYAGPLYANSLALLLYAYALLRPHAPSAAEKGELVGVSRDHSWIEKFGEVGGSPALV